MNVTQQRKILIRLQAVEGDIERLKKARQEILERGFASSTLATGGGSKSWTAYDSDKITEAIKALTTERKQLRAMLTNDGQQTLWREVLVVYS